MPVIGRIQAVLIGSAVPYARPGIASAIDKHLVEGRWRVDVSGLEGDEHADTTVHGGPDKAVHFYAFEHYSAWQLDIGPTPLLAMPGAFGENLSTLGVTEETLCLGDILQIGHARFVVTQGRQPCWKLNDRFGVPDMALRLQQTLRTGGYLRVLEGGDLGAGDEIHLCARPYPDWPLSRLMALLYQPCLVPHHLEALRQLPLVPSWRKLIEWRLEHGVVEDWSKRLNGPA